MPAAAYAGVGIQLGLTFVLFALLGRWLDARLGTGPWLLLVCVFVGAAAGFYSIYRRVIGSGSKRDRDR
jgi:F0F1-type ATP synthase assembly protein I